MTEAEMIKMIDTIANSENTIAKATNVLSMLFPYVGVRKKAVNVYIKEIEESNLPLETKIIMILNMKKYFKRIKNQSEIAEIAFNNAKANTDFSENSGVNEEWFERFMESAGFVSAKEVQIIWGKILSKEFEKPGCTPPNMIRILSEITPGLARSFSMLCSMSVDIFFTDNKDSLIEVTQEVIVPYYTNSDRFIELGIGFEVLSELETLGVIKFDSVGGYVFTDLNDKKIYIKVGDNVALLEGENDKEIPCGNVMLTSVGKVLRTIIEPVIIDGYYDMLSSFYISKSVKMTLNKEFSGLIGLRDETDDVE